MKKHKPVILTVITSSDWHCAALQYFYLIFFCKKIHYVQMNTESVHAMPLYKVS